MKVVAKTGNDTYLIEATQDEIANILGERSFFHLKRSDINPSDIRIGTRIEPSNDWNRLDFLVRNRHRGLDQLAKQCKEVIAAIEDTKPLFSWDEDRAGKDGGE